MNHDNPAIRRVRMTKQTRSPFCFVLVLDPYALMSDDGLGYVDKAQSVLADLSLQRDTDEVPLNRCWMDECAMARDAEQAGGVGHALSLTHARASCGSLVWFGQFVTSLSLSLSFILFHPCVRKVRTTSSS